MPPPRIALRPDYFYRNCHQVPRLAFSRPFSTTRQSHTNHSDLPTNQDDYYSLLLQQPLPSSAATTRSPLPEPPLSASSPPTQSESPPPHSPQTAPPSIPPPNTQPSQPRSVEERARAVFGSCVEKDREHQAQRDALSTLVAGIRIPPRPDEPNNCCMSGCVNCVWETYREELEDWAMKRREAEFMLQAEQGVRGTRGGKAIMGSEGSRGQDGGSAGSIDENGGGSENLRHQGSDAMGWDGTLFGDIPIGIREFMRTEKRVVNRKREKEMAKKAVEVPPFLRS